MTLPHVLVFVALALLIGWLGRIRAWGLLLISVLAIYWLQPATPIRYLDFWLPTLSLGLTVIIWAATRKEHDPEDRKTALILLATVALIAMLRYLDPICCLTPARPPVFWQVAVVLGLFGALTALALRFAARFEIIPTLLVTFLLALFVILKTEFLGAWASAGLRAIYAQNVSLAAASDLRWLGFSFVAFRLIHTLRDRAAGRLSAVNLREFITYVIFFPAFTAGPIDRVQHFTQELRRPFQLAADDILTGGKRLVWGLFQKFAVADTLALIALNALNASQVQTSGWAWVLLYAYAFRIYFDFSGYTDVALGISQLVGIRLPENFDRPYTRPNLTAFWNSWHMSLAQWFRAYWFNPLTRWLRSRPAKPLPMSVVIFTGQVSTMLLIGLWHGITWNFAIWGLWHGLGLFAHNRWSDRIKARAATLNGHPRLQRALTLTGILFTFHYVTLGWVWFALPDVGMALDVFGKLFLD